MTAEHILDAVGLLDDDLIQEAEQYQRPKARLGYTRWAGLAACVVLVLALGYGAAHLRFESGMSGGNATAPAGSVPSSSAAGGEVLSEDRSTPGMPEPTPKPDHPSEGNESSSSLGGGHPAIMVDGVLYWSTGEAIPVEVDESAIRTVTAYINTVPEMDGQSNFSQDLSAQYAVTDLGLVVRTDHEWILFDPVPPWER